MWIALGTEGGRLACWKLEDVLESDATLMPDLRLRPVPDCLCPALRPTFNPYSDKVEVSLVRKGLQGMRLSGTKTSREKSL